jgi:AraC-like DNA-binding protein
LEIHCFSIAVESEVFSAAARNGIPVLAIAPPPSRVSPEMPVVHKDVLFRLCKAREALRNIDDGPRSLPEVARQAGISTYHFIRLFKACFGETPHQVRLQAQLEKAKKLLLVSNRSVTDICMEVGFSSLGSFSYVFARRIGLSPSAYRQKVSGLQRKSGEFPRELIPGCISLMALSRI